MLTDQRGCDRCGNLFDPENMVDLSIRFSDAHTTEHQVCTNCVHLLTMTFRFTESRKVMDTQNRILESRQNRTP